MTPSLSKVGEFFRFFAAVDDENLEGCPKSDLVWVTHIGAMLVFTFIVVFGITYMSFDYLGTIQSTFNDTTNKIEFGSTERNVGTVLIGISIALTVAFIVMLFDRAIFQSDWFYQRTYADIQDVSGNRTIYNYFMGLLITTGVSFAVISAFYFEHFPLTNFINISDERELNAYAEIAAIVTIFMIVIYLTSAVQAYLRKATNNRYISMPEPTVMEKFSRIAIRLVVSLCLAYALSTFFELRIYESNIVTAITKKHSELNKHLYDDFSVKVTNLEVEISDQQANIANTQSRIDDLISQKDTPNNSRLNEIDEKIREAIATQEKISDQRTTKFEISLIPSLNEKRGLQKRRDDSIAEREDIQTKINGEIFQNPENIPGLSGLPGCGNNCGYFKEQKLILDSRILDIESQIAEIETSIQERTIAFEATQQQSLQTSDSTIQALNNEKTQILNQSEAKEKSRLSQLDNALVSATKNLESQQTQLVKLQTEKSSRIAELRKQIENDPEFIPFQSGPLERLKALSDLKQDSVYGPTVVEYAFWIKAFVIFLEVVPIITKMFFSPPTVYGLRLRHKVYKETMKVLLSTIDTEVQGLAYEAAKQTREEMHSNLDNQIKADIKKGA